MYLHIFDIEERGNTLWKIGIVGLRKFHVRKLYNSSSMVRQEKMC